MKKIIFLPFLFIFQFVSAQNKSIQLYDFQQSAETFTSIVSTGTKLTLTDLDDGTTGTTNIGFDFTYNGVVFTQFSACTNGVLFLGTQTSTSSSNDLSSNSLTNLITPLWDDLKFPQIDDTEGIYMQTETVSGSKVLTIEFHLVGRYDVNGVSVGRVSFQIKLFEGNNNIKFVYDDMSTASDWSEHATISIGINAPVSSTQTEYISVTPGSSGGTATVSSSECNNAILSATISTIPGGTAYLFTPPATVTDTNVAIKKILSPSSDFLTSHDTLKIKISNLGVKINEGLSLECKITDTQSGEQIGNTITEQYSDYPLEQFGTNIYTFSNKLDLSENKNYTITVSLNINNDVDLSNNQMSKEVNGVIMPPEIYNNGDFITHNGIGAFNADISEVQSTLNMWNFGYNTSTTIGYRNSDDFVIEQGSQWQIQGLSFYTWQTESDTISTMNYLEFRILNGPPSQSSSEILFDFYNKNMLSGSKWSRIYRVYDTAQQNTKRPIMFNAAILKSEDYITLSAGTYWLEWSSGGTMLSGPWTPFITKLGNTETGNALHLGLSGWEDWEEDGTNTKQGMPFLLYGSKINNLEKKSEQVEIWAEGSSGIINIMPKTSCNVSVFDILGNEVYSKTNIQEEQVIDVSSCKSGIYIVKVNGDNFILTKKIIVNN